MFVACSYLASSIMMTPAYQPGSTLGHARRLYPRWSRTIWCV